MLTILDTVRKIHLFKKNRFVFSTNIADPYYILGVDKTTPFQEIKMTFYKLANQFHPDKNDSKVLKC